MFQGGYTGKFLRINLSVEKVKVEKFDEEVAQTLERVGRQIRSIFS